MITSTILRDKFLKYFEKNEHKIQPSSSIIPAEDPTILFANAGMNQFKDLFLGNEKRSYNKAATSQKCVRAGGKHNDLDQVGFTDRHLTFFEMLGNFSFGAYFKENAIRFAWDFLTKELGIDQQKLSVTVYHSDDESLKIWHEQIGLSLDKITKLGDEDNFWQMGDTGPCGPCTEIFFDRGAEWDSKIIYGAKATRYLEIWNLVFMQYSQQEDGSRKVLTQKGVDTGMGLERLCMVLNNGETVFDTDLFTPIFHELENITGINYKNAEYKTQAAFNVVADHIRSSTMIIVDGGKPSNDGRGYVLRKIIRRGLLFLKKLTNDFSVFAKLAKFVAQSFLTAYPEVSNKLKNVEEVLELETNRFANNLERGHRFFEIFLEEAKKTTVKTLTGEKAFKLYDTYGFPLEVSRVLAIENGLDVDIEGFDKEMEKQRKQSSIDQKNKTLTFDLPNHLTSEFVGYSETVTSSKIIWASTKDDLTWLATEKNPFFAACGGQVSDTGTIKINESIVNVVQVKTIGMDNNKSITIIAVAAQDIPEQELIGKTIKLEVDKTLRDNTAKNHTGTHLLQAALRTILGDHVTQAGSLVHPDYLRFSFSYEKAMTDEEIKSTEKLVNQWICENHQVSHLYTSLEEANKLGAMALFGEKYNPETVRVICVGSFSAELCGGTHVSRSGDIGSFKIISEESSGTGVRTIIALTGPKCIELFQEQASIIQTLCSSFAIKPDGIINLVQKINADKQSLIKEVKILKQENLSFKLQNEAAFLLQGYNFDLLLFENLNLDTDLTKYFVNQVVKDKNNRLVVTINEIDEKLNFCFWFTKDLLEKIDTKEFLTQLQTKLGWKFGGKADFIQGVGTCHQKAMFLTMIKSLAGIK